MLALKQPLVVSSHVDDAPGFPTLKSDQVLQQLGMTLDSGRCVNKNKNLEALVKPLEHFLASPLTSWFGLIFILKPLCWECVSLLTMVRNNVDRGIQLTFKGGGGG